MAASTVAYSDVASLIDQYELLPRGHAEIIVEALARKGHRVTLGDEQGPGQWSLEDVNATQFWLKDGDVYEVTEVTDAPTVTLRRIKDGETLTHVIGSAQFASFTRLRRAWVDGSADS